ncbi:MAG: hypothetical protein F6K30_03655 [Cyanothece sp. SIO2G6]|nr:hypothetical protein [Cyanothece sp. SIO2G6]
MSEEAAASYSHSTKRDRPSALLSLIVWRLSGEAVLPRFTLSLKRIWTSRSHSATS